MTSPLTPFKQLATWHELRRYNANLTAEGISFKWIGADDRVWHIGGHMAGAEGALMVPPIKGFAHVPFDSVWSEPAYSAPRFERTIDKRRDMTFRMLLFDDDEYGWTGVESKWWNGMRRDTPGWFCAFNRKFGEVYVPAYLGDTVETELEDDPSQDAAMVWDIMLSVDGEPRWRQPDLRTPDWVNDLSRTTTVKRDDEKLAPDITVGVGTFKIANRGSVSSWPVVTLSAPDAGNQPARWWISDGSTTRMVRVPPLNKGEHVIIDTNPENRIAISSLDPEDDWMKQIVRNSELLTWLFGQYGESGISVLERFHGQGFTQPIAPESVGTITVYCDTRNMRASVRLPQRFERAYS